MKKRDGEEREVEPERPPNAVDSEWECGEFKENKREREKLGREEDREGAIERRERRGNKFGANVKGERESFR